MIFSAQSPAHWPFVQIRKGVLPADRDAGSRDAVCPATDSATQGGFVRMGDAEKQSQPNPNRHAHHGACAFPKKCDRLTTATRARDQKARIPRQAGARWGIFWGFRKQINQQEQRLTGIKWRRDRDSNPGWACTHNGFRDRPVRPLRHLSALWVRVSVRAFIDTGRDAQGPLAGCGGFTFTAKARRVVEIRPQRAHLPGSHHPSPESSS